VSPIVEELCIMVQNVNEELIAAWLDYLSGWPRAAQLLGKDSDVVLTLEHALMRHLKDVRRHAFKPDKRSVKNAVSQLLKCFKSFTLLPPRRRPRARSGVVKIDPLRLA